ncbi:hypothetical protein LguiA_007224 [Lonicera macranthoides]
MATEAFRKMAKLRLLEIRNTCIPKGLDCLPNELRWIDWDKYPSSSLPTTFEPDILVGLRLRRNGTAVTELPPSIGCLKNLKVISCRKSSSQSTTSVFQSLFQLINRRPKITRSLVLPPIWSLTSLTQLDLTDCNLLAVPGGLGSLFSLKELHLGGNKFENIPSLNQLSQLEHLELNRCEMLRELPELPSGIRRLFANDCVSLTLSADRFAICKLGYFWFQNCRKMLDCGENEIRTVYDSFGYIPENIILPGRAIPEWFRNHTFTEHSGLLEFPKNPKVKGYSFFVILEVVKKVKSCKLPEFNDRDNLRQYVRLSGLRHEGPVVGLKLSFRVPGHDHLIDERAIYLLDTNKIIGQEHIIMGCQDLKIFESCIDCSWKERVTTEWIDWDKYPSNSLPTTFEAGILVGPRLCRSRLKQL